MVEDALRYNSYNPGDKLHVINHGDCWNNNMLFIKDLETGKVNDHIFIDFQITRMGSPNLDITYFLFTSVKPEVRRNHLQELLQHYFDTFRRTFESFNKKCPISYEEFLEDYKRKCNFGFLFNISVMSAIGALKDIDMSDMGNDPVELMEKFNIAINNWIKNNPVRVSEISSEVVASLEEFLILTSI